jgi:hypothetical protein
VWSFIQIELHYRGGDLGRWTVRRSTASAVVMALLFGPTDGEERPAGAPGVSGASRKTAPRSHSGGLARG